MFFFKIVTTIVYVFPPGINTSLHAAQVKIGQINFFPVPITVYLSGTLCIQLNSLARAGDKTKPVLKQKRV